MEKTKYEAMVEYYYGQSDDDRVNAEIARYREALETIGTGCQNYCGPTTCVTANRIRGAEYSADAWCEQCIAREALTLY